MFFLSSSTVERAAVNGVIVVRFHAGEPLPGSPSGRGLLSYKQKQWSSILHPGTSFGWGRLLTCAPIGNRRRKKSGLTTRCRMPSCPTVLRAGSGRLGAVL